jgi:hypothetical protein
MAISNRSELRAQIIDYLGDRSDLSSSQLNIVIGLAERELNRSLRVLGAEDETDLTLSSKATSLPTDFKSVRRIYLDATPALVLEYRSADKFWRSDQGSTNGQPRIFTIQGDNSASVKQIVVSPTPDTSYTGKLLYFKNIQLTDDATSNTFLDNFEDAYLYASLKHAAILMQDFESAGMYANLLNQFIKQIDIDDNQERIGSLPLIPKAAYRETPYRTFR